MPLPSFDPSQIWNPFVSDDDCAGSSEPATTSGSTANPEDDESSNESSTESEDDTDDDGGTEPVTYGLDPDNVPRVEVTTSSSNRSDNDQYGSVADWYADVNEHRHRIDSSSIEYQGTATFELSTEAYDDLREAIREQHSGTFEGHLEEIHQDTSPRQDTLSDAI